MPETDILDLTAEDVTEAAWDELTRAMLDGQEAQLAARSSGDFDCNTSGQGASSDSCGAGCIHLHG